MQWTQLPKSLWPPYDSWPTWVPPRNIAALDVPWISSPTALHLVSAPAADPIEAESTSSERGRSIGRTLRALRRCFRSSTARPASFDATYSAPPPYTGLTSQTPMDRFPSTTQFPMADSLPLSEWRAFAEYSRPTINGVDVHNTFTDSPTPYRELDPEDINIEAVFRSLRSPSGEIHPERWIRGIQHSALPLPRNWHVPGPAEPLPFPWELQLNPFLHAAITGPAPVYWNIRDSAGLVLYGGPVNLCFPLTPQDLAQPATFPFVTHMYISGLGLAAARFPWKFFVINMRGIRVRDVFNAIKENFDQLVFDEEVKRWPPELTAHAKLEYHLRGGPIKKDGLRRTDYLGGHLFFRGLSPNPDRTGWLMFVGPAW